MHEDDNDNTHGVRSFENRLYRSRKLYWIVLLPIAIVLVLGFTFDHRMEGLLLAGLGALVAILIMLSHISDVIGYIGSVQRKAAEDRQAIRRELEELKGRVIPPQHDR